MRNPVLAGTILSIAVVFAALVVFRMSTKAPPITNVRVVSGNPDGSTSRDRSRPTGERAHLGRVPEFSLQRSDGGTLSTRDLLGKVWIADFIFTNCAADCPMMTDRLSKLQDAIPADLPVRFVSISVDPDRDTPETLESYSSRNRADRNRWFFVRGPYGEIRRIAEEGFHLGVAPAEGDSAGAKPAPGFEILHSSKFVLVDPDSQILGYYDGTDSEAVERLRRDVLALLEEKKR